MSHCVHSSAIGALSFVSLFEFDFFLVFCGIGGASVLLLESSVSCSSSLDLSDSTSQSGRVSEDSGNISCSHSLFSTIGFSSIIPDVPSSAVISFDSVGSIDSVDSVSVSIFWSHDGIGALGSVS